jgi:SAM-dependent methyltransferase
MQVIEDYMARARRADQEKGFRAQFAHPRGPLGRLVGILLARTSTSRSQAVLALLELRPADRVLDVGFGPGMDIQRASTVASFVAGIDPSEVMLRQASKRNRAAISAGQVELRCASMDEPLPYPDASFAKIVAINSFMFWQHPGQDLGELFRVLRPDGLIAIAVQPIMLQLTPAVVGAAVDRNSPPHASGLQPQSSGGLPVASALAFLSLVWYTRSNGRFVFGALSGRPGA